MPVGVNRFASLNENDEINVGPYKVRISLGQGTNDASSMSHRISELFSENNFADLMSESSSEVAHDHNDISIDDPMLALDALQQKSLENTLSFASKQADKVDNNSLIDDQYSISDKELTVQADSEYTADSAIALTQHTYLDNFTMDENTLDLLESELHAELDIDLAKNSTFTGEHITAGPLFRGLGTQVGDVRNSAQMQAIAVDLGSALKAAITGLLSLHSTANQSRYELMNKNLQPIEDNPLRLGLDYEETINTLFSYDRSPVHLSSEAAITESIQSVEHHNEAVQSAISEALDYILLAFSPENC